MELFLVTQEQWAEGMDGDAEQISDRIIGIYSTYAKACEQIPLFPETFEATYGDAEELEYKITKLMLDA